MKGVLPVETTVFFQLKFSLCIPPILGGSIISPAALGTFQGDKFYGFTFGHNIKKPPPSLHLHNVNCMQAKCQRVTIQFQLSVRFELMPPLPYHNRFRDRELPNGAKQRKYNSYLRISRLLISNLNKKCNSVNSLSGNNRQLRNQPIESRVCMLLKLPMLQNHHGKKSRAGKPLEDRPTDVQAALSRTDARAVPVSS